VEGDERRGIWSGGSQLLLVYSVTEEIKRVISLTITMGKTVLITGANRGYVLYSYSVADREVMTDKTEWG